MVFIVFSAYLRGASRALSALGFVPFPFLLRYVPNDPWFVKKCVVQWSNPLFPYPSTFLCPWSVFASICLFPPCPISLATFPTICFFLLLFLFRAFAVRFSTISVHTGAPFLLRCFLSVYSGLRSYLMLLSAFSIIFSMCCTHLMAFSSQTPR